ncbi:MAG: META domain-containing protein [Treponema sp.]|nr:META domain-containing protein [Treponema sp.]
MSRKRFTVKRILLLAGAFMLCGMFLTGVDDCEENYVGELPDFENESETAARSSAAGRDSRQSGEPAAGTDARPEQARPPAESAAGQSAQTARQSGQQPAEQTTRQSEQRPAEQPARQSGAQPPAAVPPASSGSRSAQQQAGSQQAGGPAQAAVASIAGKEWKLLELRKGTAVTVIDRGRLERDGFGDLFTINFGERVTGKAAPNRFVAPYQAGANNALAIQPPAGTLMASIYDPERIREEDYFQYLINVKSWKLVRNRLELYSSDSDGRETVLVYGN